MGLVVANLALFLTFSRLDERREQRLAERGLLALLYFQDHPYLTPKSPLDELVQRDPAVEASNLADVRGLSVRALGSRVASGGAIVRQQQAELDAKVGALVQVTEQWQASSFGYVPTVHHWWAMLTYQFVHRSWVHLLGNLCFLWLVGIRLEKTWGRGLFALFYLASGVVAASAHQVLAWHSAVPLVGASGAIAGLLGAFALQQARASTHLDPSRSLPWQLGRTAVTLVIVAWFAFEFTQAFISPWREGGVSHFAHVGGFAFGLAGAWFIRTHGLARQIDVSAKRCA